MVGDKPMTYDDRLSPPEYEEIELPWVECPVCFWDGPVFAHVAGAIIGWVCPKCDHCFREHVEVFYEEHEDWKDDK